MTMVINTHKRTYPYLVGIVALLVASLAYLGFLLFGGGPGPDAGLPLAPQSAMLLERNDARANAGASTAERARKPLQLRHDGADATVKIDEQISRPERSVSQGDR